MRQLIFQAREHIWKRFMKKQCALYLANAHSHFRQHFPKKGILYVKINVLVLASTDFRSA